MINVDEDHGALGQIMMTGFAMLQSGILDLVDELCVSDPDFRLRLESFHPPLV